MRIIVTLTLLALLHGTAVLDAPPFHAEKTEAPAAHEKHRIAIVIDDFGNGQSGTEEMLRLGVPITAAIMPFLPTTKADAEAARRYGHDVLVHLPMEPLSGKRSWLGPGAITTGLSDEEIRERVEAAIDDVPYAVGINNHMGSKATADSRVMRIVMEVCRERGLFFLDSRTNYRSKAREEAVATGVPHLSRNIFLDEVYSASHVGKQVDKLIEHARRSEATIAIGHVGPPGKITASVLGASIPRVEAVAQFVRLSELLPHHAILP